MKSDSQDVKAVLSGASKDNKYSKNFTLSAERNGNSIDIEVREENSIHILSVPNYIKLDVYIPSSFANKLNVTTSSGNIDVQDFKFSEEILHATSGNINAKSLNADNLEIKTTSGNISVDTVKSAKAAINSNSGDLKISQIDSKSTDMGNTSGKITVNNFVSSIINATSTSGNINLENIKVDESINIESISGEISSDFSDFKGKAFISATSGRLNINFSDNADIAIDAHSNSGSIRSNLPIKGEHMEHSLKGTINEGKNPVVLKTTSGSINIR